MDNLCLNVYSMQVLFAITDQQVHVRLLITVN